MKHIKHIKTSHYLLPESADTQKLLIQASELKTALDAIRPFPEELWATIQFKLKINWTYDSNAIEGSTLTRGETAFFIKEGLTVEGKPFQDFLDARNHVEAIDFVHQIVQMERHISESLCKEFNALLLSGVTHTIAINQYGQEVKKPARPGQYKIKPNHVLQPDGTIHHYVEPEQVFGEMEQLCQWIKDNSDSLHPVFTGAVFHYNFVRIHPFDDGNGRVARLMMNLILIQNGYPPAIIRNHHRRLYLDALAEGDQGNLEPFVNLVAKSLLETQEMVLADLQNAGNHN